MGEVSDFLDEETNPEARAPLHADVIEWCTNMVASAKASKQPADVIAGFERLADMARGRR